jgi:hypothetical protein
MFRRCVLPPSSGRWLQLQRDYTALYPRILWTLTPWEPEISHSRPLVKQTQVMNVRMFTTSVIIRAQCAKGCDKQVLQRTDCCPYSCNSCCRLHMNIILPTYEEGNTKAKTCFFNIDYGSCYERSSKYHKWGNTVDGSGRGGCEQNCLL